MSSRKDDFACFICDYWWLFLVLIVLVLAGVFTRPLWAPSSPPAASTPLPGTGDVQVTLSWDNRNDLDLHVIDPVGEEIFFKQAASSSNGRLDIDSNLDCKSNMTDSPIENIYWNFGEAPRGRYQVRVVYYKQCVEQISTQFKVRVLVDGEIVEFTGDVDFQGEEIQVYEFER